MDSTLLHIIYDIRNNICFIFAVYKCNIIINAFEYRDIYETMHFDIFSLCKQFLKIPAYSDLGSGTPCLHICKTKNKSLNLKPNK